MTEESAIYDRRTDHGKRAALMRLRLIEATAIDRLWWLDNLSQSSNAVSVATELSAAINEVVEYMRQTPPEGA